LFNLRAFSLWFVIVALALGACSGAGSDGTSPLARIAPLARHRLTGSTPIQHVVIIVQENRSFDNLFARFPGARGAKRGKEKVKRDGRWVDRWVTLKASPLVMTGDLQHCHKTFEDDYDGGKMDGFNTETRGPCGGHTSPARTIPYQYIEQSDIEPYWQIATEWVLADEMFQTQGSGSFTAHQDLIRGGTCITAGASCNPASPSPTTLSLVDNPGALPWGCDAPPGTHSSTINIYGQVQLRTGPFPCSSDFPDYGSTGYQTMRDLLDAAGISWKYYTPCFSATVQPHCSPSKDCGRYPCSGATYDAFDLVAPVRNGPEWGTNVSWPETNIFGDITYGQLPAVSWVIPEDANSDHPGEKCGCDNGPSWVASVVNAIGQSAYWNSSVIIVLWDDWGGFYDNAPPPFQDKWGGLGFRVPMLVLSPYAVTGAAGGYISHTQYEFGSILKYVEENWNLPSLGTTDVRANSIGDVLNYGQAPRGFIYIPSQHDAQYFIDQPHVAQRGDPE
jgi:phospholipase C